MFKRRVCHIIMMSLMIVISAVFCGCSRRPKGILSEKETIDLLTDMTIAETYEQSASARDLPDSLRRNLGDGILKAHGVDRATLDSTLRWYGRNIDEYTELYAQVDRRLSRRLKMETGNDPSFDDSNDIWPLMKHYWFPPLIGSEALVFEIPGQSAQSGERLEWSISFNQGRNLSMLLGVDYAEGSAEFIKRDFRGDRKVKLTLATDTGKTVKRIYGTLRIDPPSMPLWADSIKLSKLPFDSVAYNSVWSQKRFYGPKRTDRSVKVETDVEDFEEETQSSFKTADEIESHNRPNSKTGPGQLLDGAGGAKHGTPHDRAARRVQKMKSL